MTEIIKLEDLTLDEVKSRIKSLDSVFAENNLSFTRANAIKSPTVDLIKQSAESIDAACHDALSNAYSE